MSKSMHRIIDTTTGEVTEVAFTTKELADYAANEKAIQEAENAKATAKAALLERLGITAEEATLLLG